MTKVRIPRTKAQRGRFWATVTLLLSGAFSLWANVRSGQLEANDVIVSIWPPIAAFLSTHLISHFSPRTIWTKVLVYGVGGFIAACSMYGSGWHIVTFVHESGQPWTTAVVYVFMTDAPMLLAAAILVEKVTTARITTTEEKVASPAKAVPTPAKRTQPAKAAPKTPAKTIAPKRTSPTKAATNASLTTTFKAPVVDETAVMA